MDADDTELGAGPELDALVATQAMGCTIEHVNGGRFYLSADKTEYWDADDFHPSTAISDAWEVSERLGIAVIPDVGGTWMAVRSHGCHYETPYGEERGKVVVSCPKFGERFGRTAPEAICRAALASVSRKPS